MNNDKQGKEKKEQLLRIQGMFAVYKCKNCDGTGYDPYPNHSTAYPTCSWCNGTGESNNKHAS